MTMTFFNPQIVLGQPDNRLNQKKSFYPEIVALDENDDSQRSCSAAEALTRQEPFMIQTWRIRR
jgi:hypothetical protein